MASLLGLLLVPLAAAASTIVLDTASPVGLVGAVDVSMPDASLQILETAGAGERAIHGVTGRATLWTWTEARSARGDVNASTQVGDATAEVFRLQNATVRFALDGGPFLLVVRTAHGSAAGVAGALDADGFESRALTEVKATPPAGLPGQVFPDDVAWVASTGWPFVGTRSQDGRGQVIPDPARAFPVPREARAHFDGEARIKASYGHVEFAAADGALVSRDLGSAPAGPLALSNTATVRRLVIDATTARADLPAGDGWRLAGPSATWGVDGSVAWTHATGRASVDGVDATFEDARVGAVGRVLVSTTRPAADERVAPAHNDARGTFSASVDGNPIEAPRIVARAPVAAVGWAAVLGALGLLAWRIVGAFYTRFAPEEVLAHPRRRAIHDAVLARPGERLRDLQRAVGLAWGTFNFHLNVLVMAGHVRLRRQGAYRLVVPAALGPSDGPQFIHPVTRAVYDALPANGAAVPSVDLRARLGYSRQRLDHHIDALVARGLVEVRHPHGGRREFARVPSRLPEPSSR